MKGMIIATTVTKPIVTSSYYTDRETPTLRLMMGTKEEPTLDREEGMAMITIGTDTMIETIMIGKDTKEVGMEIEIGKGIIINLNSGTQ